MGTNPYYEQTEKWRKDPNNWKFGMFYYNPEDKSIFPPKRIRQMGMTVNFAQKWSVLVFAFIIILAVAAILYFPALNTN